MQLGRNDPCYCGSGRKYKQCHLATDESPAERRYQAAQETYAKNWRVTSQAFFDARYYHWMAKQLVGVKPRLILDIGCGAGHGLRALLDVLGDDTEIVAIDENPACLEIARETLAVTGVDVEVVKRLQVRQSGQEYHFEGDALDRLRYAQVSLIQADVVHDPGFVAALKAAPKFDAATVWLTGVHAMRHSNLSVSRRGPFSDGNHRLYVQNATYKLADLGLKAGGVLQIVDRRQAPDSELLREDCLDGHRAQASVTSLKVRDQLPYIAYEEPSGRRTPMRVTPGLLGIVPPTFETAMVSIIADKP